MLIFVHVQYTEAANITILFFKPALQLDTFVFPAKVCNMKPWFFPKLIEDVLFLTAGDKWRKVKYLGLIDSHQK